jgi:16S rRNA (cytosine1402-N4)-methyltransferase
MRHQMEIRSADQLARIVRQSVPPPKRRSIDPATRTFQALRIAVNDELKWLKVAIRRLPDLLRPGGRVAVISFHSLEDRIVKSGFANDPRLHVETRKPVTASPTEIHDNPRSRSAKMRVATRQANVNTPDSSSRQQP